MLALLAPLASAWSVPQLLRTVDPAHVRVPSISAITKLGTVPDKELQKKYDLIVVGGGPAGVAGALKGAYLGKRVLLVDKPKAAPPTGGLDPFFGGPTGLFSKALRDAAKTIDVTSLSTMGLDRDVIFQQVQNLCLRLAKNNAQTQNEILNKFKVDYLQGEATLKGSDTKSVQLSVKPHFVDCDKEDLVSLSGRKVLLCTGSYPKRPKGIPFDTKQVFDSDSINLGISFLPKSVVLVGSGIIAIEYAKIFRKLGAEVTMIVRGNALQALQRIGLDSTIAERLIKGLVDDDVTILENTVVTNFEKIEPSEEDMSAFDVDPDAIHPIRLSLECATPPSYGGDPSRGTLDAELYLACLGRAPRAAKTSLRLEEAGVELLDGGYIGVDNTFETSLAGVYAAGDCVPGPALASTGVDMAQRAVANMFTSKAATGDAPYPIGMWTIPEVGYYGLTYEQAKKKGYDADVGIATYDQCLRGRVFSPDGMLKLVFDRDTAKILGVHIIGTDACELVHYGMDLVAQEATVFDVLGTLFTAVTYHELFKEAALNANEKLEFGIQWQDVLTQLQSAMESESGPIDEEELKAQFDSIDSSGDGSLDDDELLAVFEKIGAAGIEESTVANLIRLSDDDGNGTIEWPEFQKIFKMLKKMEEKAVKDKAAKEQETRELCEVI